MLKQKLKQFHQTLTTNLKELALSYEEPTDDIVKYREDQKYYYSRAYTASSEILFLTSIKNSDFIFVGDIHTFDQNIRNVLRIMRQLLVNKNGFYLGIEFVKSNDQQVLDAFLKEQITDLEFLDSINYHDSWRFPWNHYKVLFDFIRENKIEVIALNSDGTIEQRDKHSAQILKSKKQRSPQKPGLILFGELHILPNKLPKELKLLSHQEYRYTIVHQNTDNIYFENVDNLKNFYQFSSSEFCLLNSPPWLKYESMIYWYENLTDDPDFDIHNYILDTGLKVFSSNIEENFIFLIRELLKGLGMSLSEDDILNFNLHDHTELDFVTEKIKKNKIKNLIPLYENLLLNQDSFLFFDETRYYIPNYSANRLIYLAGVHIQQTLLFKDKFKFKNIEKNIEKVFYYFFSLYCHSYFISKIINPYRKCDLYQEIEFKSLDSKIHQSAITLIDSNKKLPTKGLDLTEIHQVSKIVGYFLGEILFEQIKVKASNDLESFLSKYFYSSNIQPKNFHELKQEVFLGIDYQNTKKRFF